MIVDSSAMVSFLFGEPEGAAMVARIATAKRPKIGAPNWFEVEMVIDNRGDEVIRAKFQSIMAELNITIVSFDEHQATLAREAHRRFGKGNHPARHNYGDCMAYALAKSTGEPLLFKGNDFPQTDITPALN